MRRKLTSQYPAIGARRRLVASGTWPMRSGVMAGGLYRPFTATARVHRIAAGSRARPLQDTGPLVSDRVETEYHSSFAHVHCWHGQFS